MEFVDWLNVNEPRQTAYPNLDKLVNAAIALKATESYRAVNAMQLATHAGVHYTTTRELITNRPGFVTVKRGKKGNLYYWLDSIFKDHYPRSFLPYKGMRVPLVDTIKPDKPEISSVETLPETTPSPGGIQRVLAGQGVSALRRMLPDDVFVVKPRQFDNANGVSAQELTLAFNENLEHVLSGQASVEKFVAWAVGILRLEISNDGTAIKIKEYD